MIQILTRAVFKSERAGRSYMSLKSAVQAETRAIIKAKYPSEQAEYEDGRLTYPGFHWTSMPRFEVMQRRLARIVRREFHKING